MIERAIAPEIQFVTPCLKNDFEKAKKSGITDGSRPQSFATREEVAAMIVRAIK